ncbi:MAG: hypothetical protein R3C44_09075 [Chloroflexota bacterium]
MGALAAAVLIGLLLARLLRKPVAAMIQRLNNMILLDNLAWVREVLVVIEVVLLPVCCG